MNEERRFNHKVSLFPKRVTLELTNRCNLNCVFCPRKLMVKRTGDIDPVVAKKVLDEMADNVPVILVPFFRGESLLHPQCLDIIEYAISKNVGPIQFTTNGTLLSKENAERIIELGIDFISFSMDTLEKNVYERSRVGSNYDKVLSNILQFIELKEMKGVEYPKIQISAVETKEHLEGMDLFVKYWRNKVDYVRVYVEHSSGSKPGEINCPLPNYTKRLPCKKVFEDLVILWDGSVALCNHDWTREEHDKLGNVSDSTIMNIWNSKEYQIVRDMHLNGKIKSNSVCATCDHWKMYYMDNKLLGKLYKSEKIK